MNESSIHYYLNCRQSVCYYDRDLNSKPLTVRHTVSIQIPDKPVFHIHPHCTTFYKLDHCRESLTLLLYPFDPSKYKIILARLPLGPCAKLNGQENCP